MLIIFRDIILIILRDNMAYHPGYIILRISCFHLGYYTYHINLIIFRDLCLSYFGISTVLHFGISCLSFFGISYLSYFGISCLSYLGIRAYHTSGYHIYHDSEYHTHHASEYHDYNTSGFMNTIL